MHPHGHPADGDERRRSTVVVALVALGIAAVVALGVVIHKATEDDPAPDPSAATLVLPASFSGSFGGYARATDATSARILAGASGAKQRKAGVKTMIYTDSRRHRVLVSGASARDAAGANQILAGSRPENLLGDNLVDLKVIGAQDQDPAPFTGAFRCGTGIYSASLHTSVCGWADDDTFGVVIDLSDTTVPRIPAADLGTITRALRDGAESH